MRTVPAVALFLAALVVAPLPATVARAAATKSARPPVLPFIDDDLDRAFAEAKSRDLPVFVESWAPW